MGDFQTPATACSFMSCCCGPCRVGQTASLLESNGQDEGCFNLNCLLTWIAGPCIGTSYTRMQLRQKFGYDNADASCFAMECLVQAIIPCAGCCLTEQAYLEAKLKTQGGGAPQVEEEMGAPEPVAQVGAPVEKEMEV